MTLADIKAEVYNSDAFVCKKWSHFLTHCSSLGELVDAFWADEEAVDWLLDGTHSGLTRKLHAAGLMQWCMLTGSQWADLLSFDSDFHDYCDWEKLDEDDWEGLLKYSPELTDFKPDVITC